MLNAGHKIKSITCRYCGAVMNPHEDYKLLAKFLDQAPPSYSPLTLGAQGKLKNVLFTVVGMIEWTGEGEFWIDYQIFSPTHGYAWLVYESGNWVFLRRSRDLPNKSLWNLRAKNKVKVNQQKFRFFDSYQAKIIYVIGELTWVARIDDTTSLAEAIDPPYQFSAERNANEQEYYFGEYMEADEIEREFDLSSAYPAAKMHRLKPYKSKFLQPLAKAAKPFVLISLVITLFIWLFLQGSTIKPEPVAMTKISKGLTKSSYDFSVKHPNQLIIMTINTHKAGALLNAKITHKTSHKIIVQFGQNIKKGVTQVESNFAVAKAGVYTFSFDAKMPLPVDKIQLVIKENYITPSYFVLLLLFSIGMVIAAFMSRSAFEKKRWELAGD